MNKHEYLLKKGLIKPNQDTMYVIHSSRESVTMHEVTINNIEDQRKATRYFLSESPWELDIRNTESFGQVDGYGPGVGDLWGWSYFGSLNKEVATEIFNSERERVEKKYLVGNK